MVLTDNCIHFEKRFLYKNCSNSIPAVLSSELLGYSKEIEIDAIIRENRSRMVGRAAAKRLDPRKKGPFQGERGLMDGIRGRRMRGLAVRRLQQRSVTAYVQGLDRAAEQQVERHARKEQPKEGQRQRA